MKHINNILTRCMLMLIAMLFMTISSVAQSKKFTLVIDPGHGGRDAGAVGKISKEKNINLSVALAFGKYVEKYCSDVRVIYTRKTDKFVNLQERAAIANRNKADLFISVHTNALPKGKIARGFEVYTLGMHKASDNLDVAKRENSVITLESDYRTRYQGFDPRSAESYIIFEYMQDKNMESSVKLAKLIQNTVCSTASRVNKGVHQAGFLVLRETSMPSCLVELGFISTPDEERQLNNATVQDQIARGMFRAFQKYRGKNSKSEIELPAPQKEVQQEQNIEKETTSPVNNEVQSTVVEQEEINNKTDKPQQTRPQSNKKPTFTIQILASQKVLPKNDSQFKGLKDISHYREGNMVKYTYGASENYNEIYQLRKQILNKFPQAFIIAFKGNEKVNVNEAIREWRNSK